MRVKKVNFEVFVLKSHDAEVLDFRHGWAARPFNLAKSHLAVHQASACPKSMITLDKRALTNAEATFQEVKWLNTCSCFLSFGRATPWGWSLSEDKACHWCWRRKVPGIPAKFCPSSCFLDAYLSDLMAVFQVQSPAVSSLESVLQLNISIVLLAYDIFATGRSSFSCNACHAFKLWNDSASPRLLYVSGKAYWQKPVRP